MGEQNTHVRKEKIYYSGFLHHKRFRVFNPYPDDWWRIYT